MTSFAKQIAGKRVGLAMASGYFGFFHHGGVLKAVLERGIEPVKITGTSAGALVASMYASGLSQKDIADVLLSVKRSDFWDMHYPFTRLGFGLLGGHRFRSLLSKVLPVHSFEECSCPLAVGAYDLEVGRVRHISEGTLIPAVYASCTVPYLFTPIEIDGRRYWDGGFGEKTPLVPFLKEPETDVVLVSYMPPKESKHPRPETGWRSFIPPLSSVLADTPPDERKERDVESVRLLREANKQVLVLAPDRVWLGPFSLDRAQEAFEQGYRGTLEILDSDDPSRLGRKELS